VLVLGGDNCSESVSLPDLVNLSLISDCSQSLQDPLIDLPELNVFLFLWLNHLKLELICGCFNNACSSLFLLYLDVLLRPLGSLYPFVTFAGAATATGRRRDLLGLTMLLLHLLLKFLLDLSLVITFFIVLIVFIIIKAGEKVSFKGPIVARLLVWGEAALSVALVGEKFGFLQLLQLFVHGR
jgi:hypothetical protein